MTLHRARRGWLARRPAASRAALLFAAVAMLAGVSSCTQFSAPHSEFSAAPTLSQPTADIIPEDPLPFDTPGSSSSAHQPSSAASTDDDDPCAVPQLPVVAVCLQSPWGLAPLADGQSALVGERTTGRILLLTVDEAPEVVHTVADATAESGGMLLGVAVSPTFGEDQLIYAAVAAGSELQVIRIAQGEGPKQILTGLSTSGEHPGGALLFDRDGMLYVLTGAPSSDAEQSGTGDEPSVGEEGVPGEEPGATANQQPPGYALLRVDGSGAPAASNDSGTAVFARGFTDPSGLCLLPGGEVGVVDHRPQGDVLVVARNNGDYQKPAAEDVLWTFSPGDGGAIDCAVVDRSLIVTSRTKPQAIRLEMRPEGGFTGAPETLLDDEFGALRSVSAGVGGLAWFTTANQPAADGIKLDSRDPLTVSALPEDDRVMVMPATEPSSGGGGID